MRDPKRIDKILNQIRNLWYKYPDLRLCQLLSGAARSIDYWNNDLFYLEDSDLSEGLNLYLKENINKNIK